MISSKWFYQKDISGGINTDNSPNEIDNKQGVDALNVNCLGNKLINAKGGTLIYSNSQHINGVSKIGDDIYYTTVNGLIYKNNILVNTNIKALKEVNVSAPPSVYILEITDETGTYNAGYVPDGTPTQSEVFEGLANSISISSGTTGKYQGIHTYVSYNGVDTEVVLIKRLINAQNSFTVNFQVGQGSGTFISNNSLLTTNDYTNSYISLYDKRLFVFYSNGGGYLIEENGWIMSGLKGNSSTFYNGESVINNNTLYRLGGIGIYGGKSFYADGNKLYFSKTASLVNPYYIIDYSGYSGGVEQLGEGGYITGYTSSENGIYVFKDNEIYYSNSTQDDGNNFLFVFNKITNNGTLNPRTIQKVGQDIFYLDGRNKRVRRLSYEQNLTTLRDVSISDGINSIMDNLPSSQPFATASFKYPNYKLFLRDDISINYNNVCLTYNVDNKSWFKESANVKYSDNGIYVKDGNLYKDDTALYSNGYFISKEYDVRYYTTTDSNSNKRYYSFTANIKNTNNIYVDIIIDGQTVDTLTLLPGDNRKKLPLYNDGKYIQYKLYYNTQGTFELNDIGFEYNSINNYEYI